MAAIGGEEQPVPPSCGEVDDVAMLAQATSDVGGGFLVVLDQQYLHIRSVTLHLALVGLAAGVSTDDLAALRVDDHRLDALGTVRLDDDARLAFIDIHAGVERLA